MTKIELKRQLNVFGATMMGLGSIIGTGVFVSIGVGAGIAGSAVIIAIVIAAGVAACNGLSSAQLAANHPVSGGTYEYGYHYLNPILGFAAGWTFLLAKSASAATAALGFSGYFIDLLGINIDLFVPLAVCAVILLTLIILGGIRRSNQINILIVSITIGTLVFFVVAGLFSLKGDVTTHTFDSFFSEGDSFSEVVGNILNASALMFVAYTGYGRIATLGEEVREPRLTIPRAIIITLFLTMILYISVATIAVAALDVDGLSEAAKDTAAPLEAAARTFDIDIAPEIVAFGAITAMLGVLLNLILGLSRVLLAMGRRSDMPVIVARINDRGTTPYVAVISIGVFISFLTLLGSIETTWTFSAFTVLIYYAITNLAALRLNDEERLFPRWISWLGITACLFLAFWVELQIWLMGLALIALGLLWHLYRQHITLT